MPEQKELINNSHLYFICRKHKFRFVPECLWFDDKTLKLGFELLCYNNSIKSEGVLYEYGQYFPEAIGFSIHDKYKSKLVVHYPNNSSVTIPIEHIFPFFDAMNDLNSFSDRDIIDYEILYIGKSVGNNELSNASARIKRHEKLIEILSDTLENHPYYEIFIILASIQAPYNIAVSSAEYTDNILIKNNSLDSLKCLAKSHDKKKVVNLMVACLIKYFEPRYNELMKNTPISGTELFIKDYKKDHDINTVLTVVDTSCIPYLNLFSEKQKPRNRHLIYKTIHNENGRFFLQDIIS